MSAKGQVSIIYLISTIAIALVISAGVLLSMQFYSAELSKNKESAQLELVAQKLENGLFTFRDLLESTNSTLTMNLTIEIPERIGEKYYTISAIGNTIELRSIGSPSVVIKKEIPWGKGLLIKGYVDSKKGTITISVLGNDPYATTLLLS